MNLHIPTKTVLIDTPEIALFSEGKVQFNVLRFDLIDSITGGNKWFKLFHWIKRAEAENKNHLLSFGGPFSNHVAALAAMGERYRFKTTGIIRGEKVQNITLNRAEQQGMQLHFINRSLYREIREIPEQHNYLKQFEDVMIIPEGGGGKEGLMGAAMMSRYVPANSDHIVIASGTGTTARGIATTLLQSQQLHVIPVLRNHTEILSLFSDTTGKIHKGYEFGGYAKSSEELDLFCRNFTAETGIPIEPIYTGKALYATFDLLKRGIFRAGQTVSFIHTGGLQYQNS